MSQVSPASGVQGATINLRLSGADFASRGMEVRFSGAGVIVNGVSVVSSTSLVASVTLSGEPGMRTITVVGNGTSNAVSFEILPGALFNQENSMVTSFAGPAGGPGSADGIGAEARFSAPGGIWSDGANLYVADAGNHTIRRISVTTGEVKTVAGTPGESGVLDGVGVNARFQNPDAVWGDGTSLYIADFFGCVIRRMTIATAEVATVAGVRGECTTVDGNAETARFRDVDAVWGDGASLYAVESGRTPIRFEPPLPASIRVITLSTGEVRTIPVPSIRAFVGILHPTGIWRLGDFIYTTWFSSKGALAIARIQVSTHAVEWLFNSMAHDCCSNTAFLPRGLWNDGEGSFYFLEGRILRRLAINTGELTSIAEVPQATFNSPMRLWGARGSIYATDSGAAIVSRINLATRAVTVLAGLHTNAPLFDVRFNAHLLRSIAGDGRNLYVILDENVLKIPEGANTPAVFVSNLPDPSRLWCDGTHLFVAVSNGTAIHRVDLSTGQAVPFASGFSNAGQIWGDSMHLYFASGAAIKRVAKSTGQTETFAGHEAEQASVDGIGTTARFRSPFGIWGDETYLYVTDPGDRTLRRIRMSTAEVTTFAGASGGGNALVEGVGTAARFTSGPVSIAGDGANLYVADSGFIRKVSLSTVEVSIYLRLPGNALWSDGRLLYAANQPPNEAVLNRITLATRQVSRVFPSVQFADGVVPSGHIPVKVSWGDDSFLYGVFGQAVYKVSTRTGETTHVAGVFDESAQVDGIGSAARFASPHAMWGDGTYLYVIEHGPDGPLRRVNISTREVTTIRGGALYMDVWGDGRFLYLAQARAIDRYSIATGELVRVSSDASFSRIGSIWGDGTNLYIGDECAIRKMVLTTNEVTTLTGVDVCTAVGSTAGTVPFNAIADIWGNGRSLFVASRHTIRSVDLTTLEVKILAGHPTRNGTENGSALDARFLGPNAIWGDGLSLYVSDNGLRKITFPAAVQSYNIASAGAHYLATPSAAGALTIGYARLQTQEGSPASDGVALFRYTSNGIVVSEMAVPASPLIREGRIYAEMSGAVKTGLAIANPNSQPATISFYFTDATGASIRSGTATIAANRQIAAFLNESPFNGPAAVRAITFTSSQSVAAVALRGFTNERSEFLMTTLPVAPISSSDTAPIVLPHFAAGGGWTTQILLVNPTDDVLSGTVEMDAVYSYSIAPRSAAKVAGSSSGSQIRTGRVRVTPAFLNRAPVASTVFSFSRGGITVTESGVATTGTSSSFRILAEFDSARSMQTGIALANTTGAPALVQFELFDLAGTSAGFSGSSTIAANGQLSLFLNQIPGFQNLPPAFRGVLRVTGNAAITAIGLRARYNERGDFLIATTPALAENSPAAVGELIFPHIVSGGGYTTEFLLVSRGAASTGNLVLRSQSGADLPLPLAR